MISTTAALEQQTMNIVDDVELLAILGLTSPPRSPYLCDTLAVLDWDDMPELSATEEDEDEDTLSLSTNNNNNSKKRKLNDEDEEEELDIFAEFDFVEVSLIPQPEQKKQKTLLIQEPFIYNEVQEEEQDNDKPTFLPTHDEQDITSVLDQLISSVVAQEAPASVSFA